MANATFTDHNSQICFTLLAFWRCTLGGNSNLGNGLAHLLIVVAYCKYLDQYPGGYRHHLLLNLLLSRLHLLHLLVDHRVVEAEDLADGADDLESLVDPTSGGFPPPGYSGPVLLLSLLVA